MTTTTGIHRDNFELDSGVNSLHSLHSMMEGNKAFGVTRGNNSSSRTSNPADVADDGLSFDEDAVARKTTELVQDAEEGVERKVDVEWVGHAN